MKRAFYIITLFVLISLSYTWTYRSSTLSKARAGSNELNLTVAGFSFPYTKTTIRNFNIFYQPLIDDSSRKFPIENITGELLKLSDPPNAISVEYKPDNRMRIEFPISMKEQITNLSSGDTIHVTYKQSMDKSSIHHTYYEMKSIRRIPEND